MRVSIDFYLPGSNPFFLEQRREESAVFQRDPDAHEIVNAVCSMISFNLCLGLSIFSFAVRTLLYPAMINIRRNYVHDIDGHSGISFTEDSFNHDEESHCGWDNLFFTSQILYWKNFTPSYFVTWKNSQASRCFTCKQKSFNFLKIKKAILTEFFCQPTKKMKIKYIFLFCLASLLDIFYLKKFK